MVRPGGERDARIIDDEAKARELARSLRRQLDQRIGVEDALERYTIHLTGNGLKPVTIETHLHRLRRLLKPWGSKPLEDLTPRKAEGLYEEMRQSGASVDYHRNALASAKMLSRWAVEQGFMRHDAFGQVKGVGKKRRGKKQLRIDEARKLSAHLLEDGGEEATALLCCLLLGLRASEVVGIEARDIDDGGRLLWIADSKTDAGRRVLEVPDVLRPLLTARARGRVGRIFPGRTRYWLAHHCTRLCRAARVPEVSPHGLRGTHATLATSAGATGAMVQAALGHTSETVAQRHYTDETAQHQARQRAALQVMEGGRR